MFVIYDYHYWGDRYDTVFVPDRIQCPYFLFCNESVWLIPGTWRD